MSTLAAHLPHATQGRWTVEEKAKHRAVQLELQAKAPDMDAASIAEACKHIRMRPVSGPVYPFGGGPDNTLAGDPAGGSGANTAGAGANSSAAKAVSARADDGFEISVAPMMAWTNRHYRFLARLLTRRTLLYTEMICTSTILHRSKDLEVFLGYDEIEHPIAVQLGGADPDEMREAAIICEQWGYDEIDINVGCPSDRVAGQGCFGAALMLDHGERVKKICETVLPVLNVPFTVKCRLGADDIDKWEDFEKFVNNVQSSGVTHIIVHARKCFLSGLSPTQNRTIPPLRYDWVERIARMYPHIDFSINGGFKTLDEIEEQRALRLDPSCIGVDGGEREEHKIESTAGKGKDEESESRAGSICAASTGDTTGSAESMSGSTSRTLLRGVMVGRAAYQNPWVLSDVDRRIYGDENLGLTRRQVVHRYMEYGEQFIADDILTKNMKPKSTLRALVKPLFFLFKGMHSGALFRRVIEEECRKVPLPSFREVVTAGLSVMCESVLDTPPGPTDPISRRSFLKEQGSKEEQERDGGIVDQRNKIVVQ